MTSEPVNGEEWDVSTPEQFFGMLRGGDFLTRVAVLEAIIDDPSSAMAFGRWQGMDVVDELIGQSFSKCGITYLQIVLSALAVIPDRRVDRHFEKLFQMWEQPEVLAILTARFRALAESEPHASELLPLRRILRETTSRPHAIATAEILRHVPLAEATELIRVSALNPASADVGPRWNPDDLPAWIAELNGRFGSDVARLVESRGPELLRGLAPGFSDLIPARQVWMIEVSSRKLPRLAAGLIEPALASPYEDVVLAGLEAIRILPGGRDLYGDLATPFLESPSPAVREAAGLVAPLELLTGETVPQRIVMAQLCEAADLSKFLQDEDWRVAAAASNRAVELGPEVLPELRGLLLANPRHPTAIVQALTRLDDYEWLELHWIGEL